MLLTGAKKGRGGSESQSFELPHKMCFQVKESRALTLPATSGHPWLPHDHMRATLSSSLGNSSSCILLEVVICNKNWFPAK